MFSTKRASIFLITLSYYTEKDFKSAVHEDNCKISQRTPTSTYLYTAPPTTDNTIHGRRQPYLSSEHILRDEAAIWPSPGGTLLLYFSINSTAVTDLQYTEYGTGAEPSYPRVRSVKYPRVSTFA